MPSIGFGRIHQRPRIEVPVMVVDEAPHSGCCSHDLGSRFEFATIAYEIHNRATGRPAIFPVGESPRSTKLQSIIYQQLVILADPESLTQRAILGSGEFGNDAHSHLASLSNGRPRQVV
jgi:hypothetical protein